MVVAISRGKPCRIFRPAERQKKVYSSMTVVIAEAPRLTKLFPISIVRAPVVVKFSLVCMPWRRFRRPQRFFKRSLFEVLNAISDPEKKRQHNLIIAIYGHISETLPVCRLPALNNRGIVRGLVFGIYLYYHIAYFAVFNILDRNLKVVVPELSSSSENLPEGFKDP